MLDFNVERYLADNATLRHVRPFIPNQLPAGGIRQTAVLFVWLGVCRGKPLQGRIPPGLPLPFPGGVWRPVLNFNDWLDEWDWEIQFNRQFRRQSEPEHQYWDARKYFEILPDGFLALTAEAKELFRSCVE